MKYHLELHEFSFSKIKNGLKVIIHLYDKNAQRIDTGNILQIHNSSTNESIECIVKGIAIFDNFSDMIDALTPQTLGYDNKQEIMIRINRIFPKELQKKLNCVAFFIEHQTENTKNVSRGQIEKPDKFNSDTFNLTPQTFKHDNKKETLINTNQPSQKELQKRVDEEFFLKAQNEKLSIDLLRKKINRSEYEK